MQDMKHCLNPSTLGRHRPQLQWQQQESNDLCDEGRFFSLQSEGLLLGDGWPNHLILSSTPQYDNDNDVTRERGAASISTAVDASATAISNPTSSAPAGRLDDETPKKRKAGVRSPVIMAIGSSDEGERKEKRVRVDSGNDAKGNAEDGKQDYIHVRARRGQATDSHSLAERVRRERIGERMKYLQGLVPGCNKITGKAGMLDEIINYVQSLQKQVEFLSMKLASVNPVVDINMETLFDNEVPIVSFLNGRSGEIAYVSEVKIDMPCNSSISSVGMPSEQLVDPSFIRFNSLVDMATNPTEPLILDSCFNVRKNDNPNVNWDTELHNLYGVELHQGRASSAFPFHSLQGNFLSSSLKREL